MSVDAKEQRTLRDFYATLGDLATVCGGFSRLADRVPAAARAAKGVYFFFEPGEVGTDGVEGLRVTRVGTHGLTPGSRSSLGSRLRNHGGFAAGGNQRSSVFRRHVGDALMRAGRIETVAGWLVGSTCVADQREAEREAEVAVSMRIRAMPYLWLRIDDDAGPASGRGFIERNSIALLSSATARTFDPPSAGWLGRHASREPIRQCGLWNVRHVGDAHEDDFVQRLAAYTRGMSSLR